MANVRENLTKLKIENKKFGISVNDTGYSNSDELLNAIAEYLSAGAEIIELVGEDMPDKQFLDTAKKTKQLCEVFNASLLIRNRADIAYLSSADGVNLEQEGLDIHSARELLGEDFIIGLYTNTRESVIQSVKDGADFIIVGNIKSTPTEPVTSTGLEYAKWVSENTLFPVLACGKLSTEDCRQLKSAGIPRFLVDNSVLNYSSPNTVTVNYLDVL